MIAKDWVHGKLLDEDNRVLPFRYPNMPDVKTAKQTIETKYMPGSLVLWLEEGFVPDKPDGFPGWSI